MGTGSKIRFSRDLSLKSFENDFLQYVIGSIILAIVLSIVTGVISFIILKLVRKKRVVTR